MPPAPRTRDSQSSAPWPRSFSERKTTSPEPSGSSQMVLARSMPSWPGEFRALRPAGASPAKAPATGARETAAGHCVDDVRERLEDRHAIERRSGIGNQLYARIGYDWTHGLLCAVSRACAGIQAAPRSRRGLLARLAAKSAVRPHAQSTASSKLSESIRLRTARPAKDARSEISGITFKYSAIGRSISTDAADNLPVKHRAAAPGFLPSIC